MIVHTPCNRIGVLPALNNRPSLLSRLPASIISEPKVCWLPITITHLFQQLSIALQKGNTALLNKTI